MSGGGGVGVAVAVEAGLRLALEPSVGEGVEDALKLALCGDGVTTGDEFGLGAFETVTTPRRELFASEAHSESVSMSY